MSTRSENTVTINHPIEKVHKAYSTKEFWEFITAKLSPEPGEVNEFTTEEVTLFEVLPTTLLPEAVRAMVSQSLKVKRVLSIGGLDAEKFTTAFNADVKGTPVDFKGDINLVGAGENTDLNYTTDVSINIPLMGAAIEPKVAEALEELFGNEAKLADQWISENL